MDDPHELVEEDEIREDMMRRIRERVEKIQTLRSRKKDVQRDLKVTNHLRDHSGKL